MAKKISDLAAAAAFDGTELLEVVQGGANKKGAIGTILTPGYVDGLKLKWVSGSALTVTAGAAFVPSLVRVVRVSTDIAKAGLSLTASTWYHVYLLVTAGGAPDIEIVTTAPAAPYNGTARAKTSDTSRRYLGSVLTDASGAIYNVAMTGNQVAYKCSISAAPFLVLAAGQATVATDVACGAVVPATATSATLILANNASNAADAPMGTSDMSGALSSSNYLQYLAKGVQTTHQMPLDGAQKFNYLMTAAAGTGGLYARVVGYAFER